MGNSTDGVAKPRGRVKSCTACRQVKLRCDALANFPAACSRCKSNKLTCKIDSNFKRVSVRGRLEEMSKRVFSLENTVPNFADTGLSTDSFAHDPSIDSYDGSNKSYYGSLWLLLSDFEFNQHQTWSIGEVTINYRQASDLLSFYATHYHEHLPILERVTSVAEFHDSNRFLFWTVIRVALYHHPSMKGLFSLIVEPHRYLLNSSVLAPINDFKALQAIIILCYWPTSGVRQSDDPSWQYCGIALNTAMQMGLDQPGPGRSLSGFGGRSNAHLVDIYTRQITWLACFCISTILSVWLGLPPHVSSPAQLSTIALMSRNPEIPKSFMIQIEIQRQVVRYSTAFAGDIDSSASSSLLSLFNNELDTLYLVHKSVWDTSLEVQLLRAKLYLYSHCLNVTSKAQNYMERYAEQVDLDATKVLIQYGLHSAVSLVHNVQKLNILSSMDSDDASRSGSLIHYPKFYLQTVMFAVVFLLKFLSTNQKTTQQDRELAYSHITTAHQLFSSFSESEEHSRVVVVIEALVRNLKDIELDAMPQVKTKLGASLMYNTMKILRVNETDDTPLTSGILSSGRVRLDVMPVSGSQHIVDPASQIWNPAGISSSFGKAQADMQAELENFQWMSDEMFFEISGLPASISQ